jgi:hypothetical protein
MRRTDPALAPSAGEADACALDTDTVAVFRVSPVRELAVIVRLRGSGGVAIPDRPIPAAETGPWRLVLSTEAPDVCPDPAPPVVDFSGRAPVVRFERPGAVIVARDRQRP